MNATALFPDGPRHPGDDALLEFYVTVLDESPNAWLCRDRATQRVFWLRAANCLVGEAGERHGRLAIVPRWVARQARWL